MSGTEGSRWTCNDRIRQILLWLATRMMGTGHLIVFLRSLARNRSDLLDDAKSFINQWHAKISQGFRPTPTVRVPIDQVGSQTPEYYWQKAYLAEKTACNSKFHRGIG